MSGPPSKKQKCDDALLSSRGVCEGENGEIFLNICQKCRKSIMNNKNLPRNSIRNGNFRGQIPDAVYEKFKEIEFDLMSPCHKFGGITRIHKNGPALLSSHVHTFRLDNEVVLKELPAKFLNRFYRVIFCGAFTKKERFEALQSYIVDPKNLRKLYNIYKNYGNKFFDHLQLTKLEDDNYYRDVIFGITETVDEASDGRKKRSKKKKK